MAPPEEQPTEPEVGASVRATSSPSPGDTSRALWPRQAAPFQQDGSCYRFNAALRMLPSRKLRAQLEPTSQSSSPLDGLVDRLEAAQQRAVVVGADLVLIDQIPVEMVQLSVMLLHRSSAEGTK